jgi:hypothetical protein
MKKKYEENIYPEVVRHCSLGSPVASIRSKPIALPSSGKLTMTINGHRLHTRAVEMN